MRISIVYEKAKVLQALRYHFISRREVKLLLIVVNVFALISACLFAFKMIRPFPFLISSLLWFVLMLTFWFWLPRIIYGRSSTFKDEIDLTFRGDDILLETSRGYTTWAYNKFAYYMESPYFFHLYINDKSFFLVPKDACTGDADTIQVRQLLQEKIGKK
ncbi:MAG TPA: YcxB family protein [Phnomibacter sp.]|nr:YcxB family protein [Phnomibacter sp.]